MHTRDDPEALFATVHRPPRAEATAAAERTADAGSLEARSVLELQRMAGNASVSRLLAGDAGKRGTAEPGDEELEDDQLEAHAVGVQRAPLQAEGNRPGPPTEEELGPEDEIAPPEQSAPGPGGEEQVPDEEEQKRQAGG